MSRKKTQDRKVTSTGAIKEADDAWQSGYEAGFDAGSSLSHGIEHRLADLLQGELELRKIEMVESAKDDATGRRIRESFMSRMAEYLPIILTYLLRPTDPLSDLNEGENEAS